MFMKRLLVLFACLLVGAGCHRAVQDTGLTFYLVRITHAHLRRLNCCKPCPHPENIPPISWRADELENLDAMIVGIGDVDFVVAADRNPIGEPKLAWLVSGLA